jgi:predicted phosphoribosyltransferase
MIHNDQELQATQERIAYFSRLLAQLRVTATPEEFPAVASGYRAEISRMQDEVLEYLTRHASEPTPAEAA